MFLQNKAERDAFVKAFNPETENKTCLIALLNALLKDEIDAPIQSVHFRGDKDENRDVILDLCCIDERGRNFVVKVQTLCQDKRFNDVGYYFSQAIVNSGENDRDFFDGFQRFVSIALMDFCMLEGPEFMDSLNFRNGRKEIVFKRFSFVFVELPKFQKKLDELENDLDLGVYALKHFKELREIPEKYLGSKYEPLFRSLNSPEKP